MFQNTLNMSLHYLVKYEFHYTGDNLKRAAKHLQWNGQLYYKFVTQFANKKIFKIGKHLAKLIQQYGVLFFSTYSVHLYGSS